MAYSGYPTPNQQSGDVTFGCIPIYVPNNPEFQAAFASIIYGLYGVMANDWFWREFGTMSPENAALLAARGLAMTVAYAECGDGMTCEDVADCIETSEDVLNALLNQLKASGFSQSAENASADSIQPLPVTQTAESLLPPTFDCSSHEANMAIARAIVRELHETIIDALELMEYYTNPAEAVSTATDGIPLAGTLNNVLEFADWLLEAFTEGYSAAYDQDSEDEISCPIFCHLETECSLSLDELISIYEDIASLDFPDGDFQTVMNYLVLQAVPPTTETVATMHLLALIVFKYGGEFFTMNGWNTLRNTIETASTYSDMSYDICDCVTETPTAQWAIFLDLSLSQYTTQRSGVLGEYIGGAGWRSVAAANPAHIQIWLNLDASFVTKAHGMRIAARGMTGAAGDALRIAGWTGAGATGSEVNISSVGSIGAAGNVNNYEYAELKLLNVTPELSHKWNAQNTGASVYPTNYIQVNQVVVWGLAGAGDTKPALAKWMPALPSTNAEIFSLLGV